MMSPESEQVASVATSEEEVARKQPETDDRQTPPQPPSDNLEESEGKDNNEHKDEQQQHSSDQVAKFDGKIVYNPDGSAYIIEDGDLSDDDLPKQEGRIVDGEDTSSGGYPQIANAFVVSRSTAYYNALYGQAFVKLLQDGNVPETPVVHSYRVYSARSREANEASTVSSREPTERPTLPSVVPVKPILMCFICKLSFGCAKSFTGHCGEAHSLKLTEDEQSILDAKNSSAIVQNVGKEQEVSLSFLEPTSSSPAAAPSAAASSASATAAAAAAQLQANKTSPPMSPGAIANFLSVAAAVQQAQAAAASTKTSLPSVPIISSNVAATALSESGDDSLMRPPSGSSARLLSSQDLPSSPPDVISDSPLRRSPTMSPAVARHSSPSPSSSSSFPPSLPLLPPTATNANMLQGTTIGACPDHVNGRPTGVECTKCDLILSSSRMAGGTAWNMSRNSCKTLKCPKCNWHYKYQETLEIHMKEKHPESETTCIYCITGQQHPRLARGETYTCGYKPYRCEVCNYSTTTKGNLSIHMQSDKHLNNMQELQNGGSVDGAAKISHGSIMPSPGGRSGMTLPPTVSPTKMSQPPPPPQQQPKPNWRCDVCNYDTNVARNLRIHMTSEKHTHNMMALQQQSAKNMQQLSALQMAGLPGLGGGLDQKQLLQIQQGLGLLGGPPPTSTASSEAALADLAYNQAVLAQLMGGAPGATGQFPGLPPTSMPPNLPPDFNLAAVAAAAAAAAAGPSGNLEDTPEAMEEQQNDQNAKTMFSCCVCRDFGCDSMDDLSAHLSTDRSRTREHEVSLFIGGHYLCQLCNYKTNLKANFQLHCKTDKHLQRLSHVNHIKEGGPANEWKLRFLTSINPVELRCNACDFYTNSPHKLQVHVSNQQHQAAAVLFNHLQAMEATIDEDRRSYDCVLCKFSTKGKPSLMSHVRTMKHLQMEQIHQLQKRADGNMAQTEIGDIFRVSDTTANEQDDEPTSREDRGADDDRESTRSPSAQSGAESGGGIEALTKSCPLCSEKFPSQERMEQHAMSVHSVNSEGLTRLQSLINGSHWLNKKDNAEGTDKDKEDEEEPMDVDKKTTQPTLGSASFSYSMEKYMDPNRPFKCDVCKESFTQKNILLVHYNSVSHLHRLKKTMQEQTPSSTSSATAAATSSTPEKSSKSSALEALLGNIRGEKKDDDEVKPYKCNICKVAYSQGSTLDIHIRSVLHQTKASKLQELILTGQIDMGKPLIEQPDPQQLQEQHKKMIADMLLSPKSLNSTGSSNPQTSPNVRTSSPVQSSASPQSSPLANLQALMGVNKGDGSPSTDDETAMMRNLAKTFPMLPGLSNLSTPTTAGEEGEGKKPAPVLKNLLQNYGLDLVMQFNEMQQRKQKGDEKKVGTNANGEVDEKDEKDNKEDKSEQESSANNGDRATPASVVSNGDKEQQSRPASHSAASGDKTPLPSNPPSNFAEVQEAIQKAMMNAQLQQMNPMMLQMAQLQGLNPLIAMNLYPPLIPPNLLKQQGSGSANEFLSQLQQSSSQQQLGQLLQGGMDHKLLALMSASRQQQQQQQQKQQEPPKNIAQMISMLGQSQPVPPPDHKKNLMQLAQMGLDSNQLSMSPGEHGKMPGFPGGPNFNMARPDPGALLLPQQPIGPPQDQGKRARTRISDEQLKILRANFDINNSPAEDTLNTMSHQTGLPLKVIKHWFRNTLFKERQKNKDSPYNFNNPPSTKLNLEEYEKTGEPKVTPLNLTDQAEYIKQEAAKKETDNKNDVKSEAGEKQADSQLNNNASTTNKVPTTTATMFNESSSPVDPGLTLQRLLGSHLQPGPLSGSPGQPPALLPNFPAFPMTSTSLPSPASMPDYLNSLAKQNPRPQSPQSVGSNQGKRANRTRFTDYQIKVLQEFFENNAYPKDDDLEYLSKLLGLSPRVIVVWFQNARQKARKIYENQPPVDSSEGDEASGRFTRTSGCNYQCKKCLLVFQRYYELIRHQKQHCYKEEDARRSAQAQKAAAQAAAQFVGPPPPLIPHSEDDSKSSAGGDDRSLTSPAITEREEKSSFEAKELPEATKHQLLNYPPHTPFGILQQQAMQHHQQQFQQQQQQQHHQQQQQQQGGGGIDSADEFDSESLASSPSSKRKMSEDGELDDETVQHRDKRLRTTILPEQLDFLYQKYQVESNPSRKMLEQIAGEVGLRKRVVQVWFQNTRARERKGQFRAHSQAINKRCPFCSALFKVRTALEAHLATKHPDQPTGIVDIDALPNVDSSEDGENVGASTSREQQPTRMAESPFTVSDHIASLIPNSTSAYDLQNSMRKYYEDTMKRFMNDLADQKQQHPDLQQGQSPSQQALDLTSSFTTDDGSDHHGDGGDSDPNNRSLDMDGGHGSGLGGGSGNKRFRTQMSGVQVKMMKAIFEVYKTPTMTECSTLGREIGLQKRVVQVWFQNARAKEKRARLQLQQATGREPEVPPPPEHCVVCPGFSFGHKFAIQDHLFTKPHLDNLRIALEQGRYDPESPGSAMAQAAAALQGNNGTPPQHQSAPSPGGSTNDATSLSMLQMTTQVNNSHELIDIPARQNPRMLMQV